MCFGGGGSKGGPQYQYYINRQGQPVIGETGLPQDAIDAGITNNQQYQYHLQQQLADKQIAAQQQIASQQEAFNQQQLQYQKDLAAKQEADTQAQALRQTTYDQGRAQELNDASASIDKAFAGFTPGYYNQYATDYLSKVKDQVDYQKGLATKQLNFGLARQGIAESQAKADQLGLLEEQSGRTLAEQTQQAQNAADALRSNVSTARNNLLAQVQNAQNIGGPIAAGTIGDVTQQLDTQRQSISGITNSSGDIAASLRAVPTVSTLGDLFSGLITSTGSYLGGANAANIANIYNRAFGGTNPSAATSTTLRR